MNSAIHYFKALADETRLRLAYILTHYELNVNELVTLMNMGQSRISRHLKILTAAGLLTFRRDGLWIFYHASQSVEGYDFLHAVLPFVANSKTCRSDMAMAAALIEERSSRTKLFFNEIADDWDKLLSDVLDNFDLPRAVLEKMDTCEVACDLGCGTGAVLKAMQKKANMVIGVDGSPRMLELAKRRFSASDENISLRIGDLMHLPLRDDEADFASLIMVLHHLTYPKSVLLDAHRVIKSKGKLIIIDFNTHNEERMRTEFGDHWLGFEKETLTTMISESGFIVSEAITIPIKKGISLHIITAKNI